MKLKTPRSILCGALALVACSSSQILPGPAASGAVKTNLVQPELALIRSDSEIFTIVVQTQLSRWAKGLASVTLRYDSRPYGVDSSDWGYFMTFGREDSTLPSVLPASLASRIAANRKAVLQSLRVEEGPRARHQCAGMLMQPRASPGDSSYAAQLAELRGGCPKKPDHSFMVSVPIRGAPSAIVSLRRSQVPPSTIDWSGEIWTVLVESFSYASSGGMAQQAAWILKKDPATHRLQVVETVTLMVAE